MSAPSNEAVEDSGTGGVLAVLVRTQAALIPILAVLIALLVGALLILGQGVNPINAYRSLLDHAWFSGNGLHQTLLGTATLTLTGLAVAIPLRIGLFNIGAQGQFLVGAMTAAYLGFQFHQLPGFLLIVLSLIGGIVGGAIWGWIAGILKAKRNVHEVISTIMLNYIAAQLISWLLNSYLQDTSQALPQTPPIAEQAQLGAFGPVPFGFLIAAILAALVWWWMRESVTGFKFATVGANPEAARYAGIKLPRMYAAGMVLAGAFAGLSGGIQTLGETHYFAQSFGGTLGFDGITVALLARGNPAACVPAALLLATLRTGAPGLQFDLGVQQEIVDLILAITLLLVSIPILSKLLKLRKPRPVVTPSVDEEEAAI